MTVSKSQSKMEKRLRLRDWLELRISNPNYPGLEWVSKKDKIFRIPWKHGGRHGWKEEEDARLFREWSEHTGASPRDVKQHKANFRCALNSLRDVSQIRDLNKQKGDDAYRVYQMMPKKKGGKERNVWIKKRKSPSSSSTKDLQEFASTQPQISFVAAGTPSSSSFENTFNRRDSPVNAGAASTSLYHEWVPSSAYTSCFRPDENSSSSDLFLPSNQFHQYYPGHGAWYSPRSVHSFIDGECGHNMKSYLYNDETNPHCVFGYSPSHSEMAHFQQDCLHASSSSPDHQLFDYSCAYNHVTSSPLSKPNFSSDEKFKCVEEQTYDDSPLHGRLYQQGTTLLRPGFYSENTQPFTSPVPTTPQPFPSPVPTTPEQENNVFSYYFDPMGSNAKLHSINDGAPELLHQRNNNHENGRAKDFLLEFDENEPGNNRDLHLLSTEAAFHRDRPQLQHDDQQTFALPSASTLLPPMQGRDSGTQPLPSKAILIPSC